jgi:hypothetical protein
MSTDALWILLTIAVAPIMVWFWWRDLRRCRAVVEAWAFESDVILVRRLWTWFRISPFMVVNLLGGNQKIEYWLVRDSAGEEHRVWLKIGDFFLGATAKIDESWE